MYVGIDLAWSPRNKTGIAVVGEGGDLIHSSTVVSDDEIWAWLAAHASSPVVIGIDAPLVVPNETGQRGAERLIGQAFGRYDASAHVSNKTRSWFNPPRAETLARDAGWSIDPGKRGSSGDPVCLEVYPHPAMVGLFGLGRVLPYKAKSGRDVDARRETFGVLMDHMQRLEPLALDASSRWAEIREIVRSAKRQVDLELVEDEIDGIFCAHLAWLWHHEPDALVVYGSLEQGYIVAPPAPTHAPSPRVVTPSGSEQVEPAVLEPAVVDSQWTWVPGRPTGSGGDAHEIEWKRVVREHFDVVTRVPTRHVRVELRFVLGADQKDGREPDLDNLIKTTVDALEGPLGARPGNYPGQVDDVKVSEIVASKSFAEHGRPSGASIRVSSA